MRKEENPIARIEWMDAGELKANDYNPNVVITPEMKLLEFSIRRNGWVQPVLITKDKVIIDGLEPLCWRCHMLHHSRHRNPAAVEAYFADVAAGKQWPPVFAHNFYVLKRDHGI